MWSRKTAKESSVAAEDNQQLWLDWNGRLWRLSQVLPTLEPARLRKALLHAGTASNRQSLDSLAEHLILAKQPPVNETAHSAATLRPWDPRIETSSETFASTSVVQLSQGQDQDQDAQPLHWDDLLHSGRYHQQARQVLALAFPSLHPILIHLFYGDPGTDRLLPNQTGRLDSAEDSRQLSGWHREALHRVCQLDRKRGHVGRFQRAWQQCRYVATFQLVRWLSQSLQVPWWLSSLSFLAADTAALAHVKPVKAESTTQHRQLLLAVLALPDTALEPGLCWVLQHMLDHVVPCEEVEDVRLPSSDIAMAEMVECGCCCERMAWDQLVACGDGHLQCKPCLRRYLGEVMFGGLHHRAGRRALGGGASVPCLAMLSSEPCHGFVSESWVRLAVDEDTLFDQWVRYTGQQAMLESGLDTCQCVHCGYQVFFDARDVDRMRTRPQGRPDLVPWWLSTYLTGILGSATIVVVAAVLFWTRSTAWQAFSLLLLLMQFLAVIRWTADLRTLWRIRWRQQAASKLGLPLKRFLCPECEQATCVACGEPWKQLHLHCKALTITTDATSGEQDSLKLARLERERQLTMKVVRQCFHCKAYLMKSDGCNKLVCKCGRAMCFLCSQDITDSSYRHFCQHFRSGKCIVICKFQ